MNKTINIKLKELLLISSMLICLSCGNSSNENRKPVVLQSEIDSISNADKRDDSIELYNAAIAKELEIKKAKDEKLKEVYTLYANRQIGNLEVQLAEENDKLKQIKNPDQLTKELTDIQNIKNKINGFNEMLQDIEEGKPFTTSAAMRRDSIIQ